MSRVHQPSPIGRVGIHTALATLALLTILPFLLVVSISLTEEREIVFEGYKVIPDNWSTLAYEFIFTNPDQLINSYTVTIFVTVVGTVVDVLIQAMCAYALARKTFDYRRIVMFFIFFTVLFNGGLVPRYILITQYLRMGDTIWVLFVPKLVFFFHLVVLRTFFQRLPEGLIESAKIDGAGEFTILFRIVMPLAKPALATVALMGALMRWNDWFSALLYINSERLYPLQYLLQRILLELQFIQENMQRLPPSIAETATEMPGEAIRFAMAVVAAGPMVVVFPFFQRYFARGLTVGSIKG